MKKVMDNSRIEEQIYSSLEIRDRIADPEIIEIEKQICKTNDEIELLIPPDQHRTYTEIISRQEKLRWQRDLLNFAKIYKGAFKEGLIKGIDLDI